MAANLSFNTKGANPISSALPTSNNSSYGTTPASKALNNISSSPSIPLMKPNSSVNVAYGGNQNVPSGQYSDTPQSIVGNNPGLIPPKGQDVKSHTVTNVDGSTVSQTYHPTAQPLADKTTSSGTPITGDTQTPSGATVNSTTGGLISSPPQNSTPTPQTTYPGLIGQIQQGASQPGQAYTDAMAHAQDVNTKLQESRTNEANSLAANASNPIPLEFQQGRARVLQDQYLQQQNALAGEYQGASSLVGAANTQQSTQQSGLLGAAGLTAPTQVPYSNQYLDPTTGKPINGGASGSLPQDAQNAVNTYAQQVKAGTMTRADAESRLSAYGVAGTNALTQALGQDFNTNASNASAGTTAQGQQLQTAASATTKALDSLQTLFGNLPGAQTGGIPATNSIANWIASQLGSSALTQYNQTLHDARAQLQGVLTASGGATPTGAEAMALTYLPDNMTTSQFSSAISNVKNLVQQKVSSFTQSGNQNQNASTNTTTPAGFGWDGN